MSIIQKEAASLDPVLLKEITEQEISVEVLRLDKIHPVISGNKWFKLKYYLDAAVKEDKKVIQTYGGPWSNHLVATAAACHDIGLKSIGVVRGEKPKKISDTLEEAQAWGMKIEFVSREKYNQEKRRQLEPQKEMYVIPEGGYGEVGTKGISEISEYFSNKKYSHLLCAVGTGTMLAGFINSMPSTCTCLGIPVLKGKQALEKAIQPLLEPEKMNWDLKEGFEWGGYAKHPPALLHFMNEWFAQTGIPTDIVYTGKLFYAFTQLVKQQTFKKGSRILLIHSGGLQGNRSLESQQLLFN